MGDLFVLTKIQGVTRWRLEFQISTLLTVVCANRWANVLCTCGKTEKRMLKSGSLYGTRKSTYFRLVLSETKYSLFLCIFFLSASEMHCFIRLISNQRLFPSFQFFYLHTTFSTFLSTKVTDLKLNFHSEISLSTYFHGCLEKVSMILHTGTKWDQLLCSDVISAVTRELHRFIKLASSRF